MVQRPNSRNNQHRKWETSSQHVHCTSCQAQVHNEQGQGQSRMCRTSEILANGSHSSGPVIRDGADIDELDQVEVGDVADSLSFGEPGILDFPILVRLETG